MANRKQVKQCRFYVDLISYFHAIGYSEHFETGDAKFLYMNASSPKILPDNSVDDYVTASTTPEYFNCGKDVNLQLGTVEPALPKSKYNFIGILNHNLMNNEDQVDTDGMLIKIAVQGSDDLETYLGDGLGDTITLSDSYGGTFASNDTSIGFVPEYNGWALSHFLDQDSNELQFKFRRLFLSWGNDADHNTDLTNDFKSTDTHLQIGSYVMGRYYDTPHSPSMSLSMSRDFGGITKEKSTRGKEYANINYDSVDSWTQYLNPSTTTFSNDSLIHKIPSMEFTGGNLLFNNEEGIFFGDQSEQYMAVDKLGRKGKRTWSISFDYFSESDMWIGEEYSSNIQNTFTEGAVTQPYDYSPQLNDTTSFQWVWTHTLGGAIPFWFCPDKNLIESTTAAERRLVNENLAICTFDNKSLNVRQIAPNLYNVSVVIREL